MVCAIFYMHQTSGACAGMSRSHTSNGEYCQTVLNFTRPQKSRQLLQETSRHHEKAGKFDEKFMLIFWIFYRPI